MAKIIDGRKIAKEINESLRTKVEDFVNKYKIEKAKTTRKIKETDQNIARLRDILNEIEETLEPLRGG